MTKTELAKQCRVTPATIVAWVSKGCPHSKDRKGHYQFDQKAVERWRLATMPTKSPVGALSYSEARARKETALAGLRELQLKQKTGELVLRSAVEQAVFTSTRQARDKLQNIPSRVSGILAAEPNQQTIHAILAKEIHQSLESLSGGSPC
jgi:phage terminase Nu1 subunit (DNA packaging protein)